MKQRTSDIAQVAEFGIRNCLRCSARNGVWVQIPPWAQELNFQKFCQPKSRNAFSPTALKNKK